MKNILTYLIAIVTITLVSCDAMDDNYKEYLTDKAYSPKIADLYAVKDSAEVTLHWTNPMGNVAEKIYITYDQEELIIPEMVDSIFIDGLDVIGYTFNVYTLDKFENKSVPVEVFVFPDGK